MRLFFVSKYVCQYLIKGIDTLLFIKQRQAFGEISTKLTHHNASVIVFTMKHGNSSYGAALLCSLPEGITPQNYKSGRPILNHAFVKQSSKDTKRAAKHTHTHTQTARALFETNHSECSQRFRISENTETLEPKGKYEASGLYRLRKVYSAKI
jgi:hypothetical protein